MTTAEFEKIVREAISEIPQELQTQIDNVEIVIEDWPSKEQLGDYQSPYDLLGLYHGIPKTERANYSSLPDKISLFKEPILSLSTDEEKMKHHIRETILHELGHHFGLSDEELEEIEDKKPH